MSGIINLAQVVELAPYSVQTTLNLARARGNVRLSMTPSTTTPK